MPQTALDAIDQKILAALQANARLTNVELAAQARIVAFTVLAPGPHARRRRRHQGLCRPGGPRSGRPTGQRVCHGQLGEADRTCVGGCSRRRIRALPEVMECYLMTGDSDYLLRVVTSDLQAYEKFLMRHLTKFPGVSSIKSSFALKQVVYRTALPVSG